MGAIIEAVQTSQHPDAAAHNGVVCIFCGLLTPVQVAADHRVSIVRCGICGKEAPYLAQEITEFGEGLREPSGSLWFARDAI